MSPPRRCIVGYKCSDGGVAVPGSSRCSKHGGKAWARVPASRRLAYCDPTYLRNRKLAIQREPECHWRLPGCTLVSTQADHLVPASRGGSHDLDNLVGSCLKCNQRRGGAEGRAEGKRRAAARRRQI